MIAPDVGGGFGSKLNVYAEEALALVLARRTGRSVKWIETRQENYLATTHGRGVTHDCTIAVWKLTVPCPPFRQHRKKWFPNGMPPLQETLVDGVATPRSSAAAATAILNVDPGGNCPCTARLFRGCLGS